MKHILFFIFGLLFAFCGVYAQNFEDYSPLLSKGNLPKEVITSVNSKFATEMQEGTSKEVALTNKFLLTSRFETDMLIRSPLIVHDTTITHYFEKIADELLKDKPAIREKLHFYLLKSSAVNAFAFQDGSIFICLGTLAQLETEAQLAFIISHEIVHVENSHSLNRYLEFKTIDAKKKDKERTIGFQDKKAITPAMLKKCRFNQEQESEADVAGLQQFLKSDYDFLECQNIYKHLKFGYLPYDSIPFTTGFLGVDTPDLEAKYFLNKINPIKGIKEDKNDSLASHPNISKRKMATLKTLEGLSSEGKKSFLVSEELFEKVQTMARFELPHLFLHERFYQDAIYYAYLLSFRYPDNPYLERNIGQALYALAKTKSSGDFYARSEKVRIDSLEGELHQVYHLFDTLSAKQIMVLSANYLWKLKQKYPKDAIIGQMWQETGKEMVKKYNFKLGDFLPKTETAKTETDKKEKDKNWEMGVFANYANEKEFQSIFDSEKETKKYNAKRKPLSDCSDLQFKSTKALKLGIKKLVVVNPSFMTLDLSAGGKGLLMEETEKGRKAFVETLKENAKIMGLNAEVLHVFDMETPDTHKFNDMNLLEEWVDEQIDAANTPFIGTQQAKINELAKKYDTDYFLWTGVLDIKQTPNIFTRILWSNAIWVPPLWGPALYNIIKKEQTTLIYGVVYDVKTGKSQVIKKNFYHKKASKGMINLQCYDMLLQIYKGKARKE